MSGANIKQSYYLDFKEFQNYFQSFISGSKKNGKKVRAAGLKNIPQVQFIQKFFYGQYFDPVDKQPVTSLINDQGPTNFLRSLLGQNLQTMKPIRFEISPRLDLDCNQLLRR